MCGSNRVAPRLTQHELPWISCGNTSPNGSSLLETIFSGQRDLAPLSPDLAPCDFFLWGYLKSLVNTNRQRTLSQLKDNIRAAIADIGPDMLEKVDRNFKIGYLGVLTRTVATPKMSFLKSIELKR